jgi:hypothetical protein
MGQHTVPQRHLSNFQDPGRPGYVWLHDELGGEPRAAAIKSVLQKRGFYSPEMERFLASSVELPANQVIDKLTRVRVEGRRVVGVEAISPDERLELAVYARAMIRRVPSHRRWAETLVPGALAETTAGLRDYLQAAAAEGRITPEFLAGRLAKIDRVEEKFSRESPPEVVERVNDPLPSPLITKTIFTMTWRVLISTGPQLFITTDNPAFYFRAEGYGLGNEWSEISLPISSTHALHGCWQGPAAGLLYVAVPQKFVREINRRLASQADRLAVYHKPAPWLLQILPKKDPYLSVIRW